MEGNHERREMAKKHAAGRQQAIVLRQSSEDFNPRSACRVEQTCKPLQAFGLVVRLRKPGDEKRRVWNPVCRVAMVLALKGTKPKECSGSQPGRSTLNTLKSAESYKRMCG